MSEHTASVSWSRTTPDFAYPTYVRAHALALGPARTPLAASAAPQYHGDAALPNPEDLLVAALASCHMLTFLAVAARKGFVVDAYDDDVCSSSFQTYFLQFVGLSQLSLAFRLPSF